MNSVRYCFTVVLIAAFLLSACAPQATQAPATAAPTEVMTEAQTEVMTEAPTEAATQPPATAEATITPTLGPPPGDVSFFSTQFNVVEEGAKFRAILKDGGNYDFTGSEEGPLVDLIVAGAQAGQGQVDVVYAGTGIRNLKDNARIIHYHGHLSITPMHNHIHLGLIGADGHTLNNVCIKSQRLQEVP